MQKTDVILNAVAEYPENSFPSLSQTPKELVIQW